MMRMKREGAHYKPRKKKEKVYYSIRSLVHEITGVSLDDKGFDAARKSIERIVQTFQSLDGIDEGRLRIHRDLKDGFVKSTKAFYEKDEFKEILAKFRNDEALTIEDHDKLIQHFLEATVEGVPEVEANQLKEAVEHMMGDDYYEKRNQVEKIVIQDMEMVDKVKQLMLKVKFIEGLVFLSCVNLGKRNGQYEISTR